MSDVSYEHIAPLIAAATQQGASMQVTFRCPVNGTDVSASAPLRRDDSLGSRVADSAKRRVGWGIKSALARTIRRAVGYGIAGRIVSDAVNSVSSSGAASSRDSFSDAEKNAAVVDAFESVRSSFAWDPSQNRFISAAAAGAVQLDLVAQLEAHPVIAPYDRGVLARMLAEIAAADGTLEEGERGFFAYFITPEMGTIDQLLQRARLSPAELAESSAGPVRDTMLMLAWSLALTDHDVEAGEVSRLTELADGLGIPASRADELKRYAQAYLVDNSLGAAYASGQRDPAIYAQVAEMGRAIGMSDDAIERVDIRFRKRHGLV
ncbi:MAG: TerB family tellurite resistance protein [Haliangiales bacterium]